MTPVQENPMNHIVWNPEGKTPPRVKFDCRQKAEAEARRPADNNPGQRFYVCALVSVSQSSGAQTSPLDGQTGDGVGLHLKLGGGGLE